MWIEGLGKFDMVELGVILFLCLGELVCLFDVVLELNLGFFNKPFAKFPETHPVKSSETICTWFVVGILVNNG